MMNVDFQLKGGLADFHLPELVQFLHMNRKTGELSLYDDDHAYAGSIFLVQGELVHANLNEISGTAAFDRIMMLDHGYFVFFTDRISPNLTIERPVQVLLMEAHVRQDELIRLRAELPPAATVLSIVNDITSIPALTTQEWKILSLVNGQRTIGRIIQKINDEHTALGMLHSLLSKGVITGQKAPSPVRNLTPAPRPASSVVGERPYPPRLRTNLLLKAIDGRTSLNRLSEKLNMEMAELIEDIRLLLELNWISLAAEDEKTWGLYCQDPH
jgi:hypothetical protein